PGIAETAAADGNAIGTGLVQESERVPGLAHAAAAQHRHPDGLLDPSDHAPVGPARIGLGHTSRMDVHRGGAGVLRYLRHLNRSFMTAVWAATDLERHGD